MKGSAYGGSTTMPTYLNTMHGFAMLNTEKCNVKNFGQEHDAQPKRLFNAAKESELRDAFFNSVLSKCNPILKFPKYVRPLEGECTSRQECRSLVLSKQSLFSCAISSERKVRMLKNTPCVYTMTPITI